MALSQRQKDRQARKAEEIESAKLTLARYKPEEIPLPNFQDIPFFPDLVINPDSTFNLSIKSKDHGKIKKTLATHRYGKFSVPRHLRLIWHYDTSIKNDWLGRVIPGKLDAKEILKRKKWFAVVASGKSLHKEETNLFFTKKETHRFLNAPKECSFEEAIVYAYAGGYTDNLSIIKRCWQSELVDTNLTTSKFWRDVLRFFCVNPTNIHEMNDLCDYIGVEKARNFAYSLEGRTLHTLKRENEQWHRALARAKRMGNATWEGVQMQDQKIKVNNKYWLLHQIKTSKELAEEGTKMHHCVYAYQSQCVSGVISIWSLKYCSPRRSDGQADELWERALTIEINNRNGSAVQIRGFGNRLAKDYEKQALRKLFPLINVRVNSFGF